MEDKIVIKDFQLISKFRDELNQKPLDIDINKGSSLIIVSSIDSGKTAFAFSIASIGFNTSISSYFKFHKEDNSTKLSQAKFIALIPSNPLLLFSLIVNTLRHELSLSLTFINEKKDNAYIDYILKELGIIDIIDRPIISLSGGEKILAALAMSLVKRPNILIIDCIYDELSPIAKKRIKKILNNEQKNRGMILIDLRVKLEEYDDNTQYIFKMNSKIKKVSYSQIIKITDEDLRPLLPYLINLKFDIEKKLSIKYITDECTIESLASPLTFNSTYYIKKDNNCSNITLKIDNLTFKYVRQSSFYLGPISISIPESTTVAFIGENGVGKTTLMKCIANIINKWDGEIFVSNNKMKNNIPLYKWSHSVLYCFQDPDDQIYMPNVKQEIIETSKRHRTFDLNRFEKIVKALDLEKYLDSSPLEVPRPIKKLITLASVFCSNPKIIILDEPTAGLDTISIERIIQVMKEYTNCGGVILTVSHDYNFVSEVADNIYVLDNGLIKKEIRWPGGATPPVPSIAQNINPEISIYKKNELLSSLKLKANAYCSGGIICKF